MLKEIIEFHGPILDSWLPVYISGVQLLGAIAENESSFGKNRVSKHENVFDLGGKYGDSELWARYGSSAACSYSSFQIMYPIAVREYGLSMEVRPELLNEDHVAILYVVKYIKRKFLAGATTVAALLDAYNSGTHKDVQSDAVKGYISKGIKAYANVRLTRGLTGGRVSQDVI